MKYDRKRVNCLDDVDEMATAASELFGCTFDYAYDALTWPYHHKLRSIIGELRVEVVRKALGQFEEPLPILQEDKR